MISVKKCIGGLSYWDVFIDGTRLERFSKRSEANQYASVCRKALGRM